MDWLNFPEKELICKCGCGRCEMVPEFMDRLVKMRTDLGFPMTLSSAYRCPAHNLRESTTGEHGPHTTGRAVDIQVYGKHAFRIIAAAPLYGFTGIGVSQRGPKSSRFIHLDDLTTGSRPGVWSY